MLKGLRIRPSRWLTRPTATLTTSIGYSTIPANILSTSVVVVAAIMPKKAPDDRKAYSRFAVIYMEPAKGTRKFVASFAASERTRTEPVGDTISDHRSIAKTLFDRALDEDSRLSLLRIIPLRKISCTMRQRRMASRAASCLRMELGPCSEGVDRGSG